MSESPFVLFKILIFIEADVLSNDKMTKNIPSNMNSE